MIEMVVVIVVIGILAAAAAPIVSSVTENSRFAETKLEMQALAEAIRGNRQSNGYGQLAAFGYLGDVGAFPASLNDLVQNPGGYATWKGPYVSSRLKEISGDYKTDAWGSEYIYSGGTTIISAGSGDTIICNIAESANRILVNRVSGNLYDIDGTPPQADYLDSISVRLNIPDGAGNTVWKSTLVKSGGFFSFDSIPAGQHDLETVFLPINDTINTTVTVVPGGKNYIALRATGNLWYDETTIIPEGLVGYWRFNQGSGTEALDESGFGNDAVLYNMDPGSDWVGGKIGYALDLDGSDDYLDCGNSEEFELTQLTVACWVNSTESASYRQILGKNQLSGNDGYYFSLNNLKPSVYLGGASNEGWHDASNAIVSGEWNHVAFTYDGSKLILYINGYPDRIVSPLTGGLNANSGSDLWIGSRSDLANREYEGLLDDIRVYNRALSGSEISRLANL